MALEEEWQDLSSEVAGSLHERGLDVVHPFRVDWYNGPTGDDARRLPDLGRAHALGLLIGNSRALWTSFRAALERDRDLKEHGDPVDRYTADAVLSALSIVSARWIVRWAHDLEPEPIPIQRIASATGLAVLAPSHLSVHPAHGPWIALRAVVVVDMDGPSGPAPAIRDHCTPCHKPCVEALQRAMDDLQGAPDRGAVERDWKAWVAVRDACPVGRDSRYSDEQIRYHYTKLRELLS